MSIREKKTVLKGIRQYNLTVGGKQYPTFEIYFGTDGHGKKLRENKPTMAEARARVEEFFTERKRVGDAVTALKPTEIYDAKAALDLLRSAGLSVCLTETARAYLEGAGAATKFHERKLSEAYSEYFKGIPDKQHLHKKAVSWRVGRWVDVFGGDRMVSEVNPIELSSYLEPMRKQSGKTYNNSLSYIKTFISWCAKEERLYIAKSPLANMHILKLAYKEPEFMKVEEFEKFIRALEAHKDAARVVPFVVLSFLCGIRQEEIKRLIECRKKDIDLNAETIRISMPKGWTQGIAPRIFTLQPNALAWLMKYEDEPVLCKSPGACIETMARVAEKAKIKLGRNIGRHSFITYHAAKFQNPIMTDAITGTSKKMRAAHYQGLATKAAGEAFFSIMPSVQPVARRDNNKHN